MLFLLFADGRLGLWVGGFGEETGGRSEDGDDDDDEDEGEDDDKIFVKCIRGMVEKDT